MRILLTSRTDRYDELRGHRNELLALGHEVPEILDPPDKPMADAKAVTSIEPSHSDMNFGEAHDLNDLKNLKTRKEIDMALAAQSLYEKVADAELVVVFTDPQNHTREESYAIYGGAIWRRKPVWIIGGRFHTMHYLKDVPCFPDWPAFLVALQGLGIAERAISSAQHKQDRKHGQQDRGS